METILSAAGGAMGKSIPRRWVWALLLGAYLGTLPNSAQGAASQSNAAEDPDTVQARALFREGKDLLNRHEYAAARTIYLRAWSLKKNWGIAANLGTCEYYLGLYPDAADHLSFALREVPANAEPQAKPRTEAMLREVRFKVVSLVVEVSPPGAEVVVDDRIVGKAPLGGPVFVEPGQHVVRARMAGRESEAKTLTEIAGIERTVVLEVPTSTTESSLPPPNPVLEPPPPVPTPSQSPAVSSSREATRTPVSFSTPGSAKSAVLVTGIGLSVAALGIGAVYKAKAWSAEDEMLEASARAFSVGGSGACGAGTVLSSPCHDLSQAADQRNSFNKIANITFIAGAATVVTTVALWALWKPKTNEPSKNARVGLVPGFVRGGVSMGLVGDF